ncbi:hypothetical protein SAMN05421505_14912 [Sinosporangium album]|uniref:Uncharacterized protein n=1 Tax=Sinosporangium album TaxID=504805 RepID=A0A1G8KAT1_9ACTN|nr:hypothetical protein [Sinosporangium album]SDI40586.1 hypothetical protein SAMN05421505_14912 [Sinosporangium album]
MRKSSTTPAGPDEDAAFRPDDVPALRRDLHGWLRDGRGLTFHANMSRHAGSMIGRPDLDGHPGTMRAYARMLVEHEQRAVADAELYYVTPEMTAIIRAAAKSMPAFAPAPDDFPHQTGLIVFGAPLVEFRRPEHTSALLVDGKITLDYRDQPYEDIRIVAATWGPFDAGGSWARGGVLMSFYTDLSLILDRILEPRTRDSIRGNHARLVPDNECAIAYAALPSGSTVEEQLRESDSPGYTSHWAKHLLTTLLLMRQPLVYQRSQPIRRGLRRQLERAGHPTGDIRILDARPRRYTTGPDVPDQATDHADTTTPEEQGERRTLGVRFPVRGFWRNQWYPSRQIHRPRWIDPHWRGPDDAPIVGAQRVHVLRNNPEK